MNISASLHYCMEERLQHRFILMSSDAILREFSHVFSPGSSDSEQDRSIDLCPLSEPQDARKLPPSNGYTSKVKVLDRYKVVGFISSGTYGRVYKAVGHNGQSGEFAIKKYVILPLCSMANSVWTGSSLTRKARRFSIQEYRNQPAVRWLCAPSFRIQT